MATIATPPPDYPPEIIGYADPWILSPGDTVAIKISSTEPEYCYRTVRLIQGIDAEHAPPKKEEEISAIPLGKGQGRFQLARPGSYALVENWQPPSGETGLELCLYMQPHLPESGHVQTVVSTLDVVSNSGFAVVLDEESKVEFWIGLGETVKVFTTDFTVVCKEWVELILLIDGDYLKASLSPVVQFAQRTAAPVNIEAHLGTAAALFHSSPITFGASYADSPTSAFARATNFFNGRIDSPTMKTAGKTNRVLLKYDFALNMSSDTVVDTSGSGHHGVLVNAPTRAVKGHDWDASESDWTKAKSGYGAIHFHDDDLDDAAWETDFTITLPSDVRSGAYAVEVKSTNGQTSDIIPFFVRPTKATSEKVGAKVALVLSTFTYLAYANERLYDPTKASFVQLGPEYELDGILKTEDFYKMERRTDLCCSNYDTHNDGSGIIFSSAKRPILNIRPNYYQWGFRRPREFSADLMMIGFMEEEGIPYDIVTDHDLHSMGVAAIARYNTVITGCHPEYPSVESFDAYTAYARRGGNLMYLGGNGFYWVSATAMDRPHRLEVRRGDQGVRTYTLPGGERVHSLNGQQGSLWRSRGRACNYLFGLGCCGEGTGDGVPYKRTEASRDPSFAWIFKGIGDDELLGEHGFGGGASGDEIDKFDLKYGSPANSIVLATSTGHSDSFGIFPEDTGFPIINTLGSQTNEIRSDIVYYETSGGGAVFSVGSINWYCSLGWDGYKNNIARLTGNVLHGLLERSQ